MSDRTNSDSYVNDLTKIIAKRAVKQRQRIFIQTISKRDNLRNNY